MILIMRYPERHKAETRARIVTAAAAALRRDGLTGVSIPALMKRVGLTHGGFYGHFPDRDALVAEAIGAAANETAERVFGAPVALAETLQRYLSPGHVAHPEQGCVVAALGAEGVHQPARVRAAFARVACGLLALVDAKLHANPPTGHPEPRPSDRPAGAPTAVPREAPGDDALRLAAVMVGAVVLARLVDDEALAQRILDAARTAPAA